MGPTKGGSDRSRRARGIVQLVVAAVGVSLQDTGEAVEDAVRDCSCLRSREALFEAVYRREVQQLADLAARLMEEAQPVEALRQWMRSNVRFVATKKGMSAALALAAYKPSDLFSYSFDQLTQAVGGLLDRAIAAGEIREDISPEDLIRALVGMCYMHDQPGWQKSVLRLVDVFIDGLCNRQTQAAQKLSRRLRRHLN